MSPILASLILIFPINVYKSIYARKLNGDENNRTGVKRINGKVIPSQEFNKDKSYGPEYKFIIESLNDNSRICVDPNFENKDQIYNNTDWHHTDLDEPVTQIDEEKREYEAIFLKDYDQVHEKLQKKILLINENIHKQIKTINQLNLRNYILSLILILKNNTEKQQISEKIKLIESHLKHLDNGDFTYDHKVENVDEHLISQVYEAFITYVVEFNEVKKREKPANHKRLRIGSKTVLFINSNRLSSRLHFTSLMVSISCLITANVFFIRDKALTVAFQNSPTAMITLFLLVIGTICIIYFVASSLKGEERLYSEAIGLLSLYLSLIVILMTMLYENSCKCVFQS